MKKLTAILLAVLLIVFNLGINVSATDAGNNTVIVDNVTVIFENDSSFSDDEKQAIAQFLVNNTDIQTYGLLCSIFGHDNTTEIAVTITHCVNSTAPRCLEECWQVTTCSRCNETESTRISYSYINCCSE